MLSLSLLLGPLLFNSAGATPVSQCLLLTSSSGTAQAPSTPPSRAGGGLETTVGPPLRKPRHGGAGEGEKSACLDTTLTYGQGSAGVNTSWELESTHSMVGLDPHASLNQ